MNPPLTPELATKMDAWWRAANYLSVGQIYLLDNPLLREPLRIEHIKPRLLGHWGTTPGLNFVYVHANRAIRERDLDAIYVIGPGHGGPAIVANTWLEGTWSEVYPYVTPDEAGMKRLFRQFSFPGGIPSHVAPQVPGSIHEGGELGYSLSHAFGAAFDNPGLIHRLAYRRTNHPNLHVRGYKEEGSTTTPFDMCVRNDLDRFHLVQDVIDRVPSLGSKAAHVRRHMADRLAEHQRYIRAHGDDLPAIRDWRWRL